MTFNKTEDLIRETARIAMSTNEQIVAERDSLIGTLNRVELKSFDSLYQMDTRTDALADIALLIARYNDKMQLLAMLLGPDFEALAPALLSNPWTAPVTA